MSKRNFGINKVRPWGSLKGSLSICQTDSRKKGVLYRWFHGWSGGKASETGKNHKASWDSEHLLPFFVNRSIKDSR